MEISMKKRIVVALMFAGVAAIGPSALAEEKFLKLNRAQIQARFPDMEMTDEVHWGDVYRRNGVLVTNEMGHKTTGKWRVQRDQLCLDRGKEMGSGCYEVWLSGKNVQLKNGESSVPLEGVLKKPLDRE
jgi:hypothetical protein